MSYENPRPDSRDGGFERGLGNPFHSPNGACEQTSTWAAMTAACRWLIYDNAKTPHYADGRKRHGTLDTPEDIARLVSVDDAKAAAVAKGAGWGFGFALGPDGNGGCWQGIDLDKVDETGVGHFVPDLPGYVEHSPSGTGFHAIGYGEQFAPCGSDKSGTEAYSSGRYFTVTGKMLRDAPLTDLSPFVAAEIVPYRAKLKERRDKSKVAHRQPTTPFHTDDDTLADIASALVHFDADDRHEWMQVIHAGKTYGEAAREPVRRWSAMSGKHSDGEFNTKWDEVQPTSTSYRWIFSEAAQRGWTNPRAMNSWWNGRPIDPTTFAAVEAWRERAFGGFDGAAAIGAGETRAGNEGFEGGPAIGASENFWPDPTPLPSNLPPVARFDPAYLPEAFAAHVMDIADRMQCPPDYPAVAIVVGAGALIGTRLAIRPKPNDHWFVTPNLWGMVVGRPGTMKSPAFNEALAPLKRYENLARQENERARSQYHHAIREYTIRLKAAEAAFKKAGKPDASLNLPEPPAEPKDKRLIVGDTTYEKLSMIAADNPNGVLVNRDEVASLLSSLGREENADARGFYLTGANGRDSYTVDRVGRGHQHIDPLCLSMLGSIQPGRLDRFIRGAIKGGEADDGMVQRFGCAVWPDQSKEWKAVDRSPDMAAFAAANAAFDRLHGFVVHQSNAQYDMATNSHFVTFDDEAAAHFVRWQTDLELLLRSGDLSASIESHLSKYRKLVPALALINHLVDFGIGAVGIASLERAIGYVEYFKSHAFRIYGAATHGDVTTAHSILARIRKGDLADGFTLRDIHQRDWSGLNDRDQVAAGLELLADYGWLSAVKLDTGGRPTVRFNINPKAGA